MANIDIVNLINRWYNTNPTMTINSAREAGNYVDALAELFAKGNNINKNPYPCLPPNISINSQKGGAAQRARAVEHYCTLKDYSNYLSTLSNTLKNTQSEVSLIQAGGQCTAAGCPPQPADLLKSKHLIGNEWKQAIGPPDGANFGITGIKSYFPGRNPFKKNSFTNSTALAASPIRDWWKNLDTDKSLPALKHVVEVLSKNKFINNVNNKKQDMQNILMDMAKYRNHKINQNNISKKKPNSFLNFGSIVGGAATLPRATDSTSGAASTDSGIGPPSINQSLDAVENILALGSKVGKSDSASSDIKNCPAGGLCLVDLITQKLTGGKIKKKKKRVTKNN